MNPELPVLRKALLGLEQHVTLKRERAAVHPGEDAVHLTVITEILEVLHVLIGLLDGKE